MQLHELAVLDSWNNVDVIVASVVRVLTASSGQDAQITSPMAAHSPGTLWTLKSEPEDPIPTEH